MQDVRGVELLQGLKRYFEGKVQGHPRGVEVLAQNMHEIELLQDLERYFEAKAEHPRFVAKVVYPNALLHHRMGSFPVRNLNCLR